MLLSIREASVLLGCSPRTLRHRLRSGALPGHKDGAAWRVRREDLPLTESQSRRLDRRADDLRAAVEAALPRGQTTWSMLDIEAFRAGRQVLVRLRETGEDEAAEDLAAGLVQLGIAGHHFEPAPKIEALLFARTSFARAAARLHLSAPAGAHQQGAALEATVLPALGGLLRRAQRRGRR